MHGKQFHCGQGFIQYPSSSIVEKQNIMSVQQHNLYKKPMHLAASSNHARETIPIMMLCPGVATASLNHVDSPSKTTAQSVTNVIWDNT